MSPPYPPPRTSYSPTRTGYGREMNFSEFRAKRSSSAEVIDRYVSTPREGRPEYTGYSHIPFAKASEPPAGEKKEDGAADDKNGEKKFTEEEANVSAPIVERKW